MIEILQGVGIVLLALTSVGGWVYTVRKNGKNVGVHEERVRALTERVNKLPCIEGSSYMTDLGELSGTVNALSGRIRNLEEVCRDMTKRVDDWGDSLRRG